MKTKLDYFDNLLLDSIKHKSHRCERFPHHLYYSDEYAERIKEYFDNANPRINSLEVNVDKKYGNIPICAFGSSGRLCYLDFLNRFKEGKVKSITFELPIENDHTKSDANTKMDAVDLENGVYYECKCQEVRHKSKDGLKASYKEYSNLFNEIGIKNYLPNDKKGCLQFRVSELGIKLDGDPIYTKLHFDVKQLICHIIALANIKDGKKKKLNYVIYKPNQKLIDKKRYARKLYEELDIECKAIFAENTKIRKFCKSNGIELNHEPEYVFIETIYDFNYLETKWK